MRHWVLLLLLAITVAVIAYLVVWIFTGNDKGLDPQEPDGRAVPLPGTRPLVESDISDVRFDSVARGYRMVQVDAALRRAAYDIGYKQELIDVLEAEVVALREGRHDDAEALRQAREAALGGISTTAATQRSFAAPQHAMADDDNGDDLDERDHEGQGEGAGAAERDGAGQHHETDPDDDDEAKRDEAKRDGAERDGAERDGAERDGAERGGGAKRPVGERAASGR